MSITRYTPNFKMLVVKNIYAMGSVSKVADKYVMNISTVYRWKKEYEEKGERAFYDEPSNLLDEIDRLRRENQNLKKNIYQFITELIELIEN